MTASSGVSGLSTGGLSTTGIGAGRFPSPYKLYDRGGLGYHIRSTGQAIGSSDGSTAAADSAALSNLLLTQLSSGGTLFLDNNTYWMTTSIQPASSTTIQGSGPLSVLKAVQAVSQMFTIGTRTNLVFRDLTLDGNALASTCLNIAAGGSNLLFERCVLKNGASTVLQLTGAATNVIFRDCTTQDAGLAALSVVYTGTGTACSMTIASTELTSSVTGGPGGESFVHNVNALLFATYPTVQQLATAINAAASGVYTATVLNGQGSFACASLTRVMANIKTSAFSWWNSRRTVLIQSPSLFLRHNFVRTNTSPAIMADVLSADADITDSIFNGNNAASTAVYLSGNSCTRNKINRNIIKDVATSGVAGSTIFCDGTNSSATTVPSLLQIRDNQITHCNITSLSQTVGGAISLADCHTNHRGQSVSVSGNIIDNCGEAIFAGNYWEGVGVENNRCSNLATRSDAYAGQNAQGIEVQSFRSVVQGNTLINCGPFALFVGTSSATAHCHTIAADNIIYSTPLASLTSPDVPVGIVVAGPYVTLTGNDINAGSVDAGSIGVMLQSAKAQDTTNLILQSNMIRGWALGVSYAEAGGFMVSDVAIHDNDVSNCTLPLPTNFLAQISNAFIQNNRGLLSSQRGTATVANGTTSTTVTHGLAVLGDTSRIVVTLTATSAAPTNDYGDLRASNIGATTFDIKTRLDPGVSGLDVIWLAQFV